MEVLAGTLVVLEWRDGKLVMSNMGTGVLEDIEPMVEGRGSGVAISPGDMNNGDAGYSGCDGNAGKIGAAGRNGDAKYSGVVGYVGYDFWSGFEV